ERIELKIIVLESCSRMEMYLASGSDKLTRLTFLLDSNGLYRVDGDSPLSFPSTPSTPLTDEWDLKDAVVLNVTIDVVDEFEFLIFTDKPQQMYRPRSTQDPKISLFIPQFPSCCVVQFNMDLLSQIRQKPKLKPKPMIPTSSSTTTSTTTPKPRTQEKVMPSLLPPSISTTPTSATTPKPKRRKIKKPTLPSIPPKGTPSPSMREGSKVKLIPASIQWKTTPKPSIIEEPVAARNLTKGTKTRRRKVNKVKNKSKMASWTIGVNEEWVSTFVVLAVIFCSLMLLFTAFAVPIFICLQTPPKKARNPYALKW
ncbi:hypothetical protein PMAYCL1PPCAC_04023, partial [Pristionchus mayeri]